MILQPTAGGTVVLDASAAVRMVVGPVPDGVRDALSRAGTVIAPDLFAVEVANALWRYVRAGVFSVEGAVARLDAALGLCDRIVPLDASVLREALAEACRLGHPVYDLAYAVLARRNAAALVTLDRRLAGLARDLGLVVIEL